MLDPPVVGGANVPAGTTTAEVIVPPANDIVVSESHERLAPDAGGACVKTVDEVIDTVNASAAKTKRERNTVRGPFTER